MKINEYRKPELIKQDDNVVIGCSECGKRITHYKLIPHNGTMFEVYNCDTCRNGDFPLSTWIKVKKDPVIEDKKEEPVDEYEEFGNPFADIEDGKYNPIDEPEEHPF